MRYLKGLAVMGCVLFALWLVVCFVAWKWVLMPMFAVRIMILVWLVLAAIWAVVDAIEEAKEKGMINNGS